MIEERDDAFLAISDLHSAPTGLLRMTAAVAYGERFIVPLVNEFMARHPHLRVDIELSNRTLDLVQEGYDTAIRLGKLGESARWPRGSRRGPCTCAPHRAIWSATVGPIRSQNWHGTTA